MTDLFFEIKLFKELSSLELYKILQLRSQVFVIEQNCIYQDLDNKDTDAIHVICYNKNILTAYARCFPPNISFEGASSVGRVLIHPAYRGNRWGYTLMKKCIEICLKNFPKYPIIISAQLYLKKFYENCGFVVISETYDEDGIPHIKMEFKKT